MARSTQMLSGVVVFALSASFAAAGGVSFDLKDTQGEDSGWRVSGPSLVEFNVFTDDVYLVGEPDEWYVEIQISKNFYAAPIEDGSFPPITLSFVQMADDADTVSHIRIVDETIKNLTGREWTDFHWVLFQHEYASFSQFGQTGPGSVIYPGPDSPPPSGKFPIIPFTQYAWDDSQAGTQALSVWGGTVAHGDTWLPGHSSGGYLEIDVDLANAPSYFSFTLKELPTPEPGTIALLATGGMFVLLRRRRARL